MPCGQLSGREKVDNLPDDQAVPHHAWDEIPVLWDACVSELMPARLLTGTGTHTDAQGICIESGRVNNYNILKTSPSLDDK